MRKFLAIASIFLAFVLVGAGCAQLGQDKSSKKDPIKIGAVYPMTGPLSFFGEGFKRSLKLAVKEINSQGGIEGRKFKVFLEDTQSTSKNAASAAKKLLNVNKVDYLFTGLSGATNTLAPIAKQNNTILITNTISRAGNKNKYTFKDYWDIKKQTKALAKVMRDKGHEKISAITIKTPVTEMFVNTLRTELEKGGIELQVQKYNLKTTDFRTHITKMKNFGADGIIRFGYANQSAISFVKQLRELGLSGQVDLYSIETLTSRNVYKNVLEELNSMNTISGAISLDPNNQKAINFEQSFKDEYNSVPRGEGAYTYDDVYALKKAIENSDAESPNTKTVMENLKALEFKGAAGKLKFNKNGNAIRPAYLEKITKDGWEKYEFKQKIK